MDKLTQEMARIFRSREYMVEPHESLPNVMVVTNVFNGHVHFVSPDMCNCEDFRYRGADLNGACKHRLAVLLKWGC